MTFKKLAKDMTMLWTNMSVALVAGGQFPLDAPLMMTLRAGGNACWYRMAVWMGAL
jgi:hypothetical protein